LPEAASTNVAAAAAVLATFASGAQVSWLSRAYGISIAAALLLKIAAIVRLRSTRREPPPFTTPINLRLGNTEIPIGLIGVGAIVSLSGVAMLLLGDIPSIAAAGLIVTLGATLAVGRKPSPAPVDEQEEQLELSTSPDVSLDEVKVRPDNVLVAVRHPHSLGHLLAALQAEGDRDIVVLTIRLAGIHEDIADGAQST